MLTIMSATGSQKKWKAVEPLLRSQYPKDILNKIAINKEADIVDERNEKDLAKYQAMVKKYNNKYLGNQQNVNLPTFKMRRNNKTKEAESARVWKTKSIYSETGTVGR